MMRRRNSPGYGRRSGHERNEALDCRNYALAAFKALPKNLDAIDRQLKTARGQRPLEGEAVSAVQQPRVQRKPSRSALSDYYDDW